MTPERILTYESGEEERRPSNSKVWVTWRRGAILKTSKVRVTDLRRGDIVLVGVRERVLVANEKPVICDIDTVLSEQRGYKATEPGGGQQA